MADLLLSELHLGATYDAIVRRRLWRRMPVDVLLVPLAIVAATYALLLNGWPRSRHDDDPLPRRLASRPPEPGDRALLPAAAGGPASVHHRWLLAMAFYSPMVAARRLLHEHGRRPTRARPSTACRSIPGSCGGSAAWRPPASRHISRWTVGRTAAIGAGPETAPRTPGARRPPRRAMARPGQRGGLRQRLRAGRLDRVVRSRARRPPRGAVSLLHLCHRAARREVRRGHGLVPELRRLVRFAVWPVIGLASWAACTFSGVDALLPFLTAGLLGHYWLDGRIWTARARRLAAAT